MPCPTKPAWSGSCPDPPPESKPTLPGFRVLRCTNSRSAPKVTISAWAAANPSRLSDRTVSAPLISFFIAFLPLVFCQFSDPRRDIGQQPIQRMVLRLVFQIRHIDRDRPETVILAMPRALELARVRAAIGFEEGSAIAGREQADLEDHIDMLHRYRCRVARVGDLRDETAVLA